MGYEGCTAKLRMERVILEDSFFDETEYLCKIIAYDEEEETNKAGKVMKFKIQNGFYKKLLN